VKGSKVFGICGKYIECVEPRNKDIPVLGLNSEPILNVSSDWAEPSLRIYMNPRRIAWRAIQVQLREKLRG
jgi:hypothetical protein